MYIKTCRCFKWPEINLQRRVMLGKGIFFKRQHPALPLFVWSSVSWLQLCKKSVSPRWKWTKIRSQVDGVFILGTFYFKLPHNTLKPLQTSPITPFKLRVILLLGKLMDLGTRTKTFKRYRDTQRWSILPWPSPLHQGIGWRWGWKQTWHRRIDLLQWQRTDTVWLFINNIMCGCFLKCWYLQIIYLILEIWRVSRLTPFRKHLCNSSELLNNFHPFRL